jgi:GR25 family glycosyltransferase involved in LPS biosynthesis
VKHSRAVETPIAAYIIGQQGRYRNSALLEQLGSAFEIVEENGFYNLDPALLEGFTNQEVFLAETNRLPTLGEVACYLAHVTAWRRLLDSNHPYLAVFEDDAQVLAVGDWTSRIQIPDNGAWWISLERRPGDFLLTHLLRRRGKTLRSRLIPRGACAYIISRRAAEIGVRLFEDEGSRVMRPVDRNPRYAASLDYFVQIPPPITASESAPSLIGTRKQVSDGLIRRAIRVLKLLASNDYPAKTRVGLIKLNVLRPIKYLGSVHFFTAWAKNRWG